MEKVITVLSFRFSCTIISVVKLRNIFSYHIPTKTIISVFAFILLLIAILIFDIVSNSSSPQTIESKAAETKILSQPQSPQLDSKKLTKYLITEAVLLGAVDHISFYYKDLQSNSNISQDPEKAWVPASTIKAFVVLEAYRQKQQGIIDFNQDIVVSGQNVVPTALESDEFSRLREDTHVTIQQLVEAMIIQSDNTAFNCLLDVLGRKNINTTLQNYHLTETVVGEKLSLDDNQEAKDLLVAGRRNNTTTAKDLALFYELLYNKKVATA